MDSANRPYLRIRNTGPKLDVLIELHAIQINQSSSMLKFSFSQDAVAAISYTFMFSFF